MRKIILTLFVLLFATCFINAQTSVFTYQGKLTDTSAAANGQYDFTFRLFGAASNGTQIGTDVFLDNVAVSGGIFTVNLDFGASSFSNGTARFLEITVRTGASTGAFTTLAPRQQMTSSPFSLKSLFSTDSLQLGGIAANQFVLTGDSRLSDDRNPSPNSPNYIRNSTETQSASNFNISGIGAATGFNAATFYSIGGQRVLSNGGADNLFAGVGAGSVNTGRENAFFGFTAGNRNTSGGANSFFGSRTGNLNTEGFANSFFGDSAGINNRTQNRNTFIGAFAGENNGFNTTVGGESNTFIGALTGRTNISGEGNTAIGFGADFGAGNLSNATAIGLYATVTQSESLILGNDAVRVGIGTTAPQTKFHVSGTGIVRARVNSDSNGGLQLTLNNQPGWSVATVSGGQFQIFNDALGANAFWIEAATNRVGIGTTAPDQLLTVNGNASKTGGGSWATFSDERLKNINGRFTRGLAELMLLNPILFEYKSDNALGLRGTGETVGFSAQEVQKIIPEAVNLSESGYLQLNNDPILWTMLNSIKEQQTQIKQQQQQINALKKIVCELKPDAAICEEN